MPLKRALLDVDPSIVERNLMITEPLDGEMKHLFSTTEDEVSSKLVKPTPGFCIKTHSVEDEKIFINVCQTDAIPPPDDISESQLMEILRSEEPSDYRVPMSIGEGHPINDKSGKPSVAYDIAIHPTFCTKIKANTLFKQFFVTVMFEGIQDKYKITIKMNECKILKNRKMMGSLQLHRIQQREINRKMNKEKKLIEEMDVPTTPLVLEPKRKSLPYRLLKETDKENGQMLIAEFYIPDIASIKDVTLDIGEDRIVFESRKRNFLLDIFVPYIINQDGSAANFIKNKSILTVTMPII